MSEQQKGQLVIIGGAEDKEGECIILRRFLSLAGGRKARLVVLSTASADPQIGIQYMRLFTHLGAADVQVLALQTREEANQLHHHDTLVESTGIFFTGGDQLRITSILGGSILGSALQESYRRGIVIAGTSAGASVMSETMLVGGADDAAPSKEIIRMAPGLGLLKDVVVDQHFAQRGRIGRLLAMVAHNPYILGVGIDEDTAIVINNSAEFEVIGSGTVTVLDGREVTHSNVSDSSPQQPLALTNVKLHILTQDYRFHLQERYVRMPAK
ncbi:MAG TPA: cyanophycinase [Firmicutes bacterium]|nr:cyanophycinase [Bacillota bacterium]HAA37872.1 cyanophycinase [Bacillota bacterium]